MSLLLLIEKLMISILSGGTIILGARLASGNKLVPGEIICDVGAGIVIGMFLFGDKS